jgi:hypothetical protein
MRREAEAMTAKIKSGDDAEDDDSTLTQGQRRWWKSHKRMYKYRTPSKKSARHTMMSIN